MKAKTNTTGNARTMFFVVLFALAAGTAYGQGLLAEGAVKAFNALINNKPAENNLFIKTDLQFADRAEATTTTFSPVIVESFSVSNVEVSYEQNLRVEEWMKVPFRINNYLENNAVNPRLDSRINNMETDLETEPWMAEPLYLQEGSVEVEEWMTEPFGMKPVSGEEELEVEEWMTRPLF